MHARERIEERVPQYPKGCGCREPDHGSMDCVVWSGDDVACLMSEVLLNVAWDESPIEGKYCKRALSGSLLLWKIRVGRDRRLGAQFKFHAMDGKLIGVMSTRHL